MTIDPDGVRRAKNSWRHMHSRCYDPDNSRFRWYGARGIAVCDRWSGPDGFENFLADMGGRPKGKSIDRIDNDGDYEPGNCRWASPKEQSRNRRTSKLTKKDAVNIRSDYEQGLGGYRTIAKKYGVSFTMVRHIVIGKKWS